MTNEETREGLRRHPSGVRPVETCPVCGYTSPYVRIEEGLCPECTKRRNAEMGERQRREAYRLAANRTKAEYIARERHRWGRSHSPEFCIMCKVEKSLT